MNLTKNDLTLVFIEANRSYYIIVLLRCCLK